MTLKSEIKNSRLFLSISTISIAVLSVLFAILDGTYSWGITSHPILTFFFVFISGFAVVFLISGFTRKYNWHTFIGSILFGIALLYALIDVFVVKWWIILIVMFAFIFIAFAIAILLNGNKTEDIALNNHEEYKDYKQRREEKLAKEAEEPEEELPTIKSFKD